MYSERLPPQIVRGGYEKDDVDEINRILNFVSKPSCDELEFSLTGDNVATMSFLFDFLSEYLLTQVRKECDIVEIASASIIRVLDLAK